MKEYIGKCEICNKPIYCMDGFFNGIKTKTGVRCFDCDKENLTKPKL
ncbi:hypothetical protein [Bacillus sp. Marseille-Q3570]|nr:hypothetical protein [Bacillus sp. Marseille-Q3570]